MNWNSLRSAAKRTLPPQIFNALKSPYYLAFRLRLRLRCIAAGLREKLDLDYARRIREASPRPLPPPMMRHKVGEDTDPFLYVSIGKRIAGDVKLAIDRIGTSMETRARVLDFGCGCGRALSHLMARYPALHFTGVDVDDAAIQWCRANLSEADFHLGSTTPPLSAVANQQFDLIFAASVFTHLDGHLQALWLEELHNLLAPGGVLVVTVNGDAAAARAGVSPAHLLPEWSGGVAYFASGKLSGIHPPWYQTSFNQRSLTESAFRKYFSRIHYVAEFGGYQDAIVGRKELPQQVSLNARIDYSAPRQTPDA